jgi:hypothetical protein
MRDIPVAKLSAFLVLIGLVIGGWRSWHVRHDGRPLAGMDSAAHIELLTTADKASWVRAQAYSFNYLHQGQYQITVKYLDSREAMLKVIAGAEKPVLWSPESPVWISRANDIWRKKSGHDLVAMDDFSTFRVFLKSPLVFLTTRKRAEFLRRYLAGDHPWTSIHEMCTGRIDMPGGRLRFSVADPLLSNSGAAAVDMMLTEYAAQHHESGSLEGVAGSSGFASFLDGLRSGVVSGRSANVGTADLANDYIAHPDSRDFIVTYENLAFEAARRNPDLEVIYPSPTMVAEQSVGIAQASWVTPAQRAGADAFMAYVSRPESIKSGLKYDMRSAVTSTGSDLEARLAAANKQGFQSTFTTEEPAPYAAVNIAAAQWLKQVGS